MSDTTGPVDAASVNRAELAALDGPGRATTKDAVRSFVDTVKALTKAERERDEARATLDALPALLREDSPAGDALRERLGLRWEIHYASMYGPPRSRSLSSINREPLS